MFGSSEAACRNERSDSMNQNECICETPWLKNLRASSEVVVTGMSVVPMPGNSFAGSDGCAPGGTMQRSASGRWARAGVAATKAQSTAAARICGFIRTV